MKEENTGEEEASRTDFCFSNVIEKKKRLPGELNLKKKKKKTCRWLVVIFFPVLLLHMLFIFFT